jgi:3',5'-cyclic-AMP phosphodiesterase
VPRIVHVSDSHLSAAAPEAGANWSAVVEYVRRDVPDLVVHSGDISLNGADDPDDLEHARERLAELPSPWLAIPGNHDIGDFGDVQERIDATRYQRYVDVFGADNWSTMLDGWRVVGLDVQALVAGIDVAGDVWSWLEGELSQPGPAVLFLHRPMRPWAADEDDHPVRYVTEPARERLTRLIASSGVRMVGSGHVHQWRRVEDDGRAHVWAPSTWASLPDWLQPVIGSKLTGVVEHTLHDDSVTSTVVQPPGIADLVLGEDIESPYDH